ncbi:MAG: rhodanese-like domain-containing protein [Aquisalimonadaceae bacterium]
MAKSHLLYFGFAFLLFGSSAVSGEALDCPFVPANHAPSVIPVVSEHAPIQPDQRAACLNLPSALVARAGASTAAIVDVRSPRHFEAVHVQGSVNLPPHLIPSRRFLEAAPLVLLGGDGDISELLGLCARLRSERRQVVFVEPRGLHADWAQGRLAGNDISSKRHFELSPGEFHRTRQVLDWAVVVIAEDDVAMAGPNPVSRVDPSEAPTALRRVIDSLAGASERVLIIDGSGLGTGVLSRYLEGADLRDVRFLTGGLSGYRQFSVMTQGLLARRSDSSPSRGSCESLR